jgi:hypothetical protein
MTAIPMTNIGGIEVSRVTCGTNPFNGFSHFSKARDDFMRAHFTKERIVEVLETCRQEGINTILGPQSELNYEAIQDHQRQTGYEWIWMCTPGGTKWQDVVPGVKWCADHGAQICMPHQGYTDNNLIVAENRIEGAEEILQCIRDHGMIPGWSSHRPETILVTDSQGYDCEAYILPYNSAGFLCAVETDWTGHVIRNAEKPVVVIKPLAAARVHPATALTFVFNTIKPDDTVAVGFMSPDEVREDMEIIRETMQRRTADIELQYTRSKQSLVKK